MASSSRTAHRRGAVGLSRVASLGAMVLIFAVFGAAVRWSEDVTAPNAQAEVFVAALFLVLVGTGVFVLRSASRAAS